MVDAAAAPAASRASALAAVIRSAVSPSVEEVLRTTPLLTRPAFECATGRLRLPVAGVTYPAPWYGHPPALVPFWSEGFVYTGLWRHWFTERPPSIVRFYVRAGPSLREVARTAAQFTRYAVVLAIVAADGVTHEIAAFARAAAVADLHAVDAATLETGDDPRGLTRLPEFRVQTPLASVADPAAYDGWFPTDPLGAAPGRLEDASSLEVPEEVRAAWAAASDASPRPRWFGPEPAHRVFDDAMQAGDLKAAWFALNSAGWRLPDARHALAKLDRAAADPSFSRLCRAWLEASDGQIGGW